MLSDVSNKQTCSNAVCFYVINGSYHGKHHTTIASVFKLTTRALVTLRPS